MLLLNMKIFKTIMQSYIANANLGYEKCATGSKGHTAISRDIQLKLGADRVFMTLKINSYYYL